MATVQRPNKTYIVSVRFRCIDSLAFQRPIAYSIADIIHFASSTTIFFHRLVLKRKRINARFRRDTVVRFKYLISYIGPDAILVFLYYFVFYVGITYDGYGSYCERVLREISINSEFVTRNYKNLKTNNYIKN